MRDADEHQPDAVVLEVTDGSLRENGQIAEITTSLDLTAWPAASRVMQVLGNVRPGPTSTTSASTYVKTTTARAHKTQSAKRRKRAPRGANRQAVLRAASERPGATRAELAAVSGVEPNTLSGLLGRLVKAGELQTRALSTGRTGYALADRPAAQPDGTESADAEDTANAGITPPATAK